MLKLFRSTSHLGQPWAIQEAAMRAIVARADEEERSLHAIACEILALCVLATVTILAVQTKAVCLEQTVVTPVRNELSQLVEQVQVQRSCQVGFGLVPLTS